MNPIRNPIPRHYRCILCGAAPTIRVFSGVGAGGFAGCERHANAVIDRALAPMLDRWASRDYITIAYDVIYAHDGPRLGRPLWRAMRKAA